MTFWTNLKEIIRNLPLVLSDSYDPKDISLNRISTVILILNTTALIWYTVFHHDSYQQLLPILDRVIGALGVQLGVVNMVKRGIDTYKDVKTTNKNTMPISAPKKHDDNG